MTDQKSSDDLFPVDFRRVRIRDITHNSLRFGVLLVNYKHE